jgi:uncharacterized protein VirK/YbjX
VPAADGNWEVPSAAPERRLEDVPSRKRAMDRRRRELTERLRAAVAMRWAAGVGAAHGAVGAERAA